MPCCKSNLKNCFERLCKLIYPRRHMDEQTIQLAERSMILKAQIAMAFRLLSFLVNRYTEVYGAARARKWREQNPEDIKLEFFDKTVAYCEAGVYVGRALQFLFLFLSFKWPKVGRIFFVSDLVVTMIIFATPFSIFSVQTSLQFNLLLI